MGELAAMDQLAQNVPQRFTKEWFAAGALRTSAWAAYQVGLVRRLARDIGGWGRLNAAYYAIGLIRANPAAADIAGSATRHRSG
jgi:hypothetical protein